DQLAEKPEEVVELEGRAEEGAARVEEKARRHARCESALHELEVVRGERAAREARREALLGEIEILPAGYDAAEHGAAQEALVALRQVEQRAVALEEGTRRRGEWAESRRVAELRWREARARVDGGRA